MGDRVIGRWQSMGDRAIGRRAQMSAQVELQILQPGSLSRLQHRHRFTRFWAEKQRNCLGMHCAL